MTALSLAYYPDSFAKLTLGHQHEYYTSSDWTADHQSNMEGQV